MVFFCFLFSFLLRKLDGCGVEWRRVVEVEAWIDETTEFGSVHVSGDGVGRGEGEDMGTPCEEEEIRLVGV